jgi:hypothetical protein
MGRDTKSGTIEATDIECADFRMDASGPAGEAAQEEKQQSRHPAQTENKRERSLEPPFSGLRGHGCYRM